MEKSMTKNTNLQVSKSSRAWERWGGLLHFQWVPNSFKRPRPSVFFRGYHFVKIFQRFINLPRGLTAIFEEKFGSLRGENWQISPPDLRSNQARFSNRWYSTLYKTNEKQPILSNNFTNFHLYRYPPQSKEKENLFVQAYYILIR